MGKQKLPVVAPIVSFHDELVSSRHEGQAVGVVERLWNVQKEGESHSVEAFHNFLIFVRASVTL